MHRRGRSSLGSRCASAAWTGWRGQDARRREQGRVKRKMRASSVRRLARYVCALWICGYCKEPNSQSSWYCRKCGRGR